MWPYFYALAFGLTGAFYAKRLKKNPYTWFFIGMVCKAYTLLLIFLPLALSRVSVYLLKKRYSKKINSPLKEDITTIDAFTSYDLNVSAEATTKFWYFLEENKKTVGPMSFVAFYKDWKSGKISSDAYAWNESFSDWVQIKELTINKEGRPGF